MTQTLMLNSFLHDHVTIILVSTKSPANIGSAARCMMNMGMHRLVLVDPPRDRTNQAYRLAAGADYVIRNAIVVSTLADAITGQQFVIGTSRHQGKLRKNVHTPHELAHNIIPLLSQNKIAIVFGNEVNGLTRSELSLCHEIISIPSSKAFPSLNLSHAVLIVAYELHVASTLRFEPINLKLAGAEDLENFYLHLQKTLEAIGFLDGDHPERIMFSLRQIFGRSRLDCRDVKILRGILSNINRVCAKQ